MLGVVGEVKVSRAAAVVQTAAPVELQRMSTHDPETQREFAAEVVRRLRAAGYEALWAGGCVRDRLLGREPKDYDVATSALPHQVATVFGERRTLGIGAAFGVMAVLGPRKMCVEVATYRQDGQYLDGRHPEAVTFSTAEKDAQRRDFTINGLFFDPVAEQVIDYVGGQADLERRVVRAIGRAEERFDEDKLRMLRAVRFAATYDFALDGATLDAIRHLAGELVVVSAERIAEEMRRMLRHARRARAVQLLRDSRLLEIVLPESQAFDLDEEAPPPESGSAWQRTQAVLDALEQPSFPVALAALVRELGKRGNPEDRLVETVGPRWRLTNDEVEEAAWVRRHEALARDALATPWPRLQRVLIGKFAPSLLTLAEASARVENGSLEAIAFCRAKLALPAEELNPPPLLGGHDLIRAGLRPGPIFQILLEAVRDAQLDGQITTPAAALEFALALAKEKTDVAL